jgi:hypothetical protein
VLVPVPETDMDIGTLPTATIVAVQEFEELAFQILTRFLVLAPQALLLFIPAARIPAVGTVIVFALPLLPHQRVPPAKRITVSTAQNVPVPVIIGPQALLAIRQRFILATLSENATQLTAARHAIPTSFHGVAPPLSRRLIIRAGTTPMLTLRFTPPLQSP